MNKTNETQEIWRRRRYESAQAYEAAQTYFELGAQRSHAAVAKRLGKSIKQLEKWSPKYEWVKRAAAYDAWREQIRLEEAERLAKQEAEKWAQREREQREDLYLICKAARDRIKEALKYPLAQVTKTTKADENGRATEITIVKPVKWTLDSVARLTQVVQAVGGAAIRNEGTQQDEIVEEHTFDNFVPYTSRSESKQKGIAEEESLG